ncbi:protein of unknown function [Methylorubrum extorquens]|uniref:Uncharacterized protein n=1 Tax=Methylorubrum extorquens TaxID=408 RepID=A0A2N9APR8_METEX|nr:protein of unknown function [Methylorubrum extorquens]
MINTSRSPSYLSMSDMLPWNGYRLGSEFIRSESALANSASYWRRRFHSPREMSCKNLCRLQARKPKDIL